MRRIAFAAAAVLVLGAAPATWAAGDDEPAKARDADDTGVNARDRDDTGVNARDRGAEGGTAESGTKPTAMDQSNDPADVKLTADIRKAIVDDDSLSTNARNVKIITNGGNVVLRGPVDSAEERDKIAAKAKQVAGVKRVDNQLEINEQ